MGADGRIRRQVLGEGNYDNSEQFIQQLLTEANGAPVTQSIVPIIGEGVEAPPDERNLASPETYVGYERATGFASTGGLRRDAPHRYAIPSVLPLNHWALDGDWSAAREFAALNGAAGRVAYRFHARDLHLIISPPPSGHAIRFKVTIDGAAPLADHGVDSDGDGLGTVVEPRMYQLVRQKGAIKDRTVEIEFLDPGVRVYDFTFG